jgi:hypothetical protein
MAHWRGVACSACLWRPRRPPWLATPAEIRRFSTWKENSGERPDSLLERNGFELPVRGSGEAGLWALFLASIAWDGSARRSGFYG